MKKSLKVIIGLCLVSLMSFSMVAAARKPVKVTFWQLADRKEYYDCVVADFNKEHSDVRVEMAFFSTDGMKENLKVAAASNSLPTMWFNWGGTLGSFYPENGLAYDLTTFAKENKWADKFLPATLELSTYNGKLYGYPLTINMMGVFYNKDAFAACGLTPPRTFSEFENVLKVLKENGYTPLSLGGKYGWHLMRLTEALIEMYAGAEVHDQLNNLEAKWTHPGVVKAYEKYKEFVEKGYFLDGFIALDPANMWNPIFAGKTVLTIEGQWAPSSVLTAAQPLEKYGYFYLPLSKKGSRISSFVEMVQFSARLSKEELKAAVKFLDYCFSDKVIKKYPTLTKYPTAYKNGYLPSEYAVVNEMISDMNEYGAFTITDQALPQEIVNKLFYTQDMIAIGSMTPKQAAEYMQKEIEMYKKLK